MQSLAAALSVGATVASAPIYVVKALGVSASVGSDAQASLAVDKPIGSSIQSGVSIVSSDTSVAYVFESVNNTVQVTASGDIPLLIQLTAGLSDAVVNTTPLGGSALGGGSPFTTASSSATATAIIVFAASAQVSCRSYAIGYLEDTIPLATLSGVGSISNAVSADVSLVKPISGLAASQSSPAVDVNLVHYLGASVASSSSSSASVLVTKNCASTVSSTSYAAPANTSVAYVVASNASVASAASADVRLVKPIAGQSSSVTSVTANTSVRYVVSASVLTLVSVNADLHKTDNLQDLSGTGSISNILSAGLHLRKNLNGSLLNLAASDGKLFVAHAVDAEIATGATATLSVGSISAEVNAPMIFAEITDVSYISGDYGYWREAA